VAGDFTGDGVVDGRDYVLWRSELGQTGPSLQADGNRDYVVDMNDYNLWRLHFGQVAGSGAETASVPEPESIGMLTLLGLTYRLLLRAQRTRSYLFTIS
jgi:hypothetical protein